MQAECYTHRDLLRMARSQAIASPGGPRMFQSRKWVALFAAFLAAYLYAPRATAQQPLWQQLNAQSTQLYQQGRYADALPIAIEAVKAAEEAFGPDSAWVAADLNNLAQIYNSQGRYTEAEPPFQRALQVQEKVAGPDDRTVATFLSNIGLLYDNEGRYPEAEPLFLRAVRIHEKTAGPENPDVAVDLNNLSVLYHHQGRYAEAETLCQHALRIDEKASSTATGSAYTHRGFVAGRGFARPGERVYIAGAAAAPRYRR
jgi:tetratricopeptide (TPR) repeat protein